jgi:hypothetical protein
MPCIVENTLVKWGELDASKVGAADEEVEGYSLLVQKYSKMTKNQRCDRTCRAVVRHFIWYFQRSRPPGQSLYFSGEKGLAANGLEEGCYLAVVVGWVCEILFREVDFAVEDVLCDFRERIRYKEEGASPLLVDTRQLLSGAPSHTRR